MSKAVWWGAGIFVIILLAAFGYWTISPFFIKVQLNEELPTSSSAPQPQDTPQSGEAAPAQVVRTAGHPASGTARVVVAEGKTYIRYENFSTLNGPDIFVYLSKDLEAKEFVNLGAVKATEGNINYEVPASVTIADYPYVLTWCRTFSVLFNYAKVL